jgi:hypothetical protein
MFNHHRPNFCKLLTSETFGHSQIDRVQPILGYLVSMLNVNMWRLGSFSTEEEKPETVQ